MKIRKPHKFIPYKKFPDRYFDNLTDQEFPKSEIDEHPAWYKWEYDNNEKEIYYEDNTGHWEKAEYNEDGYIIYIENNDGKWEKWEYNEDGKVIYWENSYGQILDRRI